MSNMNYLQLEGGQTLVKFIAKQCALEIKEDGGAGERKGDEKKGGGDAATATQIRCVRFRRSPLVASSLTRLSWQQRRQPHSARDGDQGGVDSQGAVALPARDGQRPAVHQRHDCARWVSPVVLDPVPLLLLLPSRAVSRCCCLVQLHPPPGVDEARGEGRRLRHQL
jgi:hypothetical protein